MTALIRANIFSFASGDIAELKRKIYLKYTKHDLKAQEKAFVRI